MADLNSPPCLETIANALQNAEKKRLSSLAFSQTEFVAVQQQNAGLRIQLEQKTNAVFCHLLVIVL